MTGDTMTMEEDMGKMAVAVGKIEQHLSDMNGKLVDYHNHMVNICPEQRKGIYKAIDVLKEKTIKNGAIIGVLLVVINAIIVTLITKM